jgi:hypothetical protein
MPRGKLIAVDHIGGAQEDVVREQALSETHTIRFVFHDFENLPHKRKLFKKSSNIWCHGYQWRLELFPGGNHLSKEDPVHLSLGVICVTTQKGDCEVKARFAVRVPSTNFSKVCAERLYKDENAIGLGNFLLRSDVLDPSKGFLVDGKLTIEVDMQVYKDASPFWEPKNELQIDMMKIFESADQSGDITFLVGREEFSAHLGILEARAPELGALAKDFPSDTPIPIEGIKPSAFRSLLRFIYADDIPNRKEFRKEARDLLDVANRFGCKGLKLAAEAELVESGITVETAADMIMMGDAKNCALLKEAAIDLFTMHPTAVMSSSGWVNMRESAALLAELMEVVVASNNERDDKRMSVSSLRRQLDKRGLDVDGSKEMLIRRLFEEENGDGYANIAQDSWQGED